MNNKVHVDAQVLQLIFYKYKAYVLPVISFAISWILFFQIVLPQLQNFLSVKDTVAANETTLAQLTQNYNTIAALSQGDIDSELTIAKKALPEVKDFAGILDAISQAAAISGVSVNDYSFQVGDINTLTSGSSQNASPVEISLTIDGDINKTKQFLNALSKQLPLSEVTSLTITGVSTTAITANFFFQPASRVTFVDTSPLPVLTAQQKTLLLNLNNDAVSSLSAR